MVEGKKEKDLDKLIQDTIDQIRKNGDVFVFPEFLLNVPQEVSQRWLWELLQAGPFVAVGNRGLTLSALGQTVVRDYNGQWKKYLRAQRFNQRSMFWVAVVAVGVSLISVFITFLRPACKPGSGTGDNSYYPPYVLIVRDTFAKGVQVRPDHQGEIYCIHRLTPINSQDSGCFFSFEFRPYHEPRQAGKLPTP